MHDHDCGAGSAPFTSMPGEGEIAALAEFFRMMGSDTRLKILLALDAHEMCAGDLAQALDAYDA